MPNEHYVVGKLLVAELMGDLIPLALHRHQPRHGSAGRQRDIGQWICRGNRALGKVTFALYCVDGLEGFATLSGITTGIRAAIEVDGALYAVAGTQLWKIQSNGNVTSL